MPSQVFSRICEGLTGAYKFATPRVAKAIVWLGHKTYRLGNWVCSTTSRARHLTLSDQTKSAILAATYASVAYVAAHAFLLPSPIAATVVTAIATLATDLLSKYFHAAPPPLPHGGETPATPTP